ncbi:hypothetical protein J2Z31_005907 [Sinorhizobium kostiense]|uniref:Uncharacterized protein n=1 Tax=Sinorhizobium kostiense TaxID=76747 RepID=A0ABS4R8Y5_9HYPH|nr:hypothetical protein [Sinorhizobium kostiense]MBP2239365.1 hypothetical protein [Sinorhizobium kostiense]
MKNAASFEAALVKGVGWFQQRHEESADARSQPTDPTTQEMRRT